MDSKSKGQRGTRDDPQVSGLSRGWEQRSREAGKGAGRAPPHVAAAQMVPTTTSKADHRAASVISEDDGKSSKKQGKRLLQGLLVETLSEDVSDGKTSSKCLKPEENLCLF